MYFFFDTETTGLWDFKLPDEDPTQPRILQIGAIVADKDGNVMQELNTLLKPDDWIWGEDAIAASEIHGKTFEMCEKYGLSQRGVMEIVERMLIPCHTVVAHNLKFDNKMMRGECIRLGKDRITETDKAQFCTMLENTKRCKLPGKFAGSKKWPNLQEAHKHYFDVGFDGAHDAMEDIRACMRVFFATLQAMEKE